MEANQEVTTSTETCSSLKKGSLVLIQDRPCKITQISFAKPGKGGHSKGHIVGMDLLNDSKLETVCLSHETIQVPLATNVEFELVTWDEEANSLSLLTETGEINEDIPMPEGDLGQKIVEAWKLDKSIKVSVLTVCGQSIVKSMRVVEA